jgi:hypothetical protein
MAAQKVTPAPLPEPVGSDASEETARESRAQVPALEPEEEPA